MSTDAELAATRIQLKVGEYNGVDIMRAWLAIDELLRLRAALAEAAPVAAAPAVPAQVVEALQGLRISADPDGRVWIYIDGQAEVAGAAIPVPSESAATALLHAERIRAALTAQPAASQRAGVVPSSPMLTLTGAEVLALAEFVIPDCITVHKPEDQATAVAREFIAAELESTVSVHHLPDRTSDEGEHMPAGFYAWMADYPEEGCVPLAATPAPEGGEG